MHGQEPKVTIGLPVYNGEEFLDEAIQSILGQTFEDFELIISDNCSTDRTGEICRKYELQDSRVRYLRNQSNVGASENYNRLCRMAKSPYFKWAAADDKLDRDFLRRCVEVLDADPSVALVQSDAVFIDPAGTILEVEDAGWNLPMASAAERMRYVIQSGHWCNAMFGLMRRDALARTRLIGDYRGGDFRTLGEMALLGKFVEIPGGLFLRRLHPDSSSQNPALEWQLQFYTPHKPVVFSIPLLQRNFDHLRAVILSDLTLREKASLARLIARQLRWSRAHIYHEVLNFVRRLVLRIGHSQTA